MSSLRQRAIRTYRGLRRQVNTSLEVLNLAFDRVASLYRYADISIFHKLQPPPSGGGHQFIRMLWEEIERRGLRVENNTISATTRACLFNSFNFDHQRLLVLRRAGCRMVHRVDGPIEVYRGRADGSDAHIWCLNQELADATIFQSKYSMQKHLDLGYTFVNPLVIQNTTNPRIFHSQGRVTFDRGRKIRLISSSWSDNPRKGGPIYRWIEGNLDWDRFDYTFVGRASETFSRIRQIAPVPSEELADILRQHDIYITASQNDPCSNALIEALACGLPTLYIQSGGHAELVGEAGFAFTSPEEIPDLLELLVDTYEMRQAKIHVLGVRELVEQYLRVMGIEQ